MIRSNYPNSAAPISFAASRCRLGATCEYRSSVTAIVECPFPGPIGSLRAVTRSPSPRVIRGPLEKVPVADDGPDAGVAVGLPANGNSHYGEDCWWLRTTIPRKLAFQSRFR